MNDMVVSEQRNITPIHQNKMLSAGEIRTQVNVIQEVMKSVMQKDTHYGKIPGCDKETLYKAGSEVLLTTFRIAVEPVVEDLSTTDVIRYRVKTIGKHQTTGIIVGVGIGECSSDEDKYKWRSSICDKEYEQTPEDRKRIKFARKKGGGHYEVKQIRTNPADIANTVLKMAKKRSQVDLTLTSTAASDIFTQDIEDLPEGYLDDIESQDNPPKQLPPCSDFEKNFPVWKKLIESGKNSAGGVLSMLNSKYTLTDEQKQRVNNVKVITDEQTVS